MGTEPKKESWRKEECATEESAGQKVGLASEKTEAAFGKDKTGIIVGKHGQGVRFPRDPGKNYCSTVSIIPVSQ